MPWQNVSNASVSSESPGAFGTGLFDEPYGTIARSFPRWMVTSNVAMGANAGVYRQIVLPAGLTAGAMTFLTATTAKLGGSHGWYAVTDQNLNVLAVTADQTDAATTWGTANSPQKLAFTSPLQTSYTGIYYAAISVTASTLPTFGGTVIMAVAGTQAPPIPYGIFTAALALPPAVGSAAPSFGAVAGGFGGSYYVNLSVS